MWNMITHHFWWLLALLLIGGELLVPGYFLLWIGLAAVAVGILLWLLPALGLLAQAVSFALAAVLACVVYARFVRPRLERSAPGSEQLNRRGAQMIGQRYVLAESIVHGRGKAQVGDGQWLVCGPDAPVGSMVEVLAVEGTMLKVRPAA